MKSSKYFSGVLIPNHKITVVRLCIFPFDKNCISLYCFWCLCVFHKQDQFWLVTLYWVTTKYKSGNEALSLEISSLSSPSSQWFSYQCLMRQTAEELIFTNILLLLYLNKKRLRLKTLWTASGEILTFLPSDSAVVALSDSGVVIAIVRVMVITLNRFPLSITEKLNFP